MKLVRPTPLILTSSVLCLALGGCANLPGAPDSEQVAAAAVAAAATTTAPASSAPGAAPHGSPTATAAAAAAAAAVAATSQYRPFAEVIKGAKETPGLFHVWQKDDRVWIEIAPDQFDQPYFLKSALNQGLGEKRIFGGMMTSPVGVEQVVVFHKIGSLVQLIAKNVKYTARENTPEARSLAQGFSDSLLSSAPVASQPHPDRKSILIDANALLLADIPAGAPMLERTYHQPYGFDPRNSSLGKIRATADMVTLDVSAHYSLTRLVPAGPGASKERSSPPSTLPDVRSLFLGYQYTFAQLPPEPMRPRSVDERIGYFWVDRLDFTSDRARVPVVRYIERWRLEKKDPAAALSEPKQQIVYWLDRNIPEKYRVPIRDGILEWNKAFERIGFKDAIRVEVQPDDAEFDTSDIRHASVRWLTTAHSAFAAVGPRVADPRTGEILDADIGIDASSVRVARNLRLEYVPELPAMATPADPGYCAYGSLAAEQAEFGLALLEARGELDAESPQVDRFIEGYLKDVAMHELGHSLGLTHNFRASTVYSEEQLANREFTQSNGISGSVMDYNPWNLALKGAKQGEYQMSTLGPYDYWAIEYGYKEIAPEQESAELAKIAGRSTEPQLAFAMDDSLFYSGLDPEVNTFDLGTEPLSYARKRFALARELLQRTETRQLKPGETYSLFRRNLVRGLADAQASAAQAVKYVGGLTLSRDRAGTGRAPLTPVTPNRQRAALTLVTKEVLSADSFRFSPKMLRDTGVTYFDQLDAEELGRPEPPVDIAIDQRVLAMQRAVLTQLMSADTAQRLLNNEAKVDSAEQALRLSELYETLHTAIWSELKSGRDVNLFRRNLQREYVNGVATALLKPSATMPADARSLLREEAKTLRHEIAAAQAKPRYSKETRAHLAESLATLDEALKAPLVRQGV